MNKKPIITLNKLNFYRDKALVLQDINLEIYQGEIITIIGPNGSGKTTLLSILAGIIKTNKVHINTQLTTAYMPQYIKFDATLPINVFKFLSLSHPQERIFSILEKLEIADIIYSQMYELSGGELQKVLFANCLLAQPNIMILDEPVSSMDINSSSLFYTLLAKFRACSNCTIVMASHDLYVVMKNTDRVICLNKKIHCEGKPNEIVVHNEFINLFGKNITLYEHHHQVNDS